MMIILILYDIVLQWDYIGIIKGIAEEYINLISLISEEARKREEQEDETCS